MNTKTKSTFALVLTLATGCAATATASDASPRAADVTCHGKAATYVATEGNDVLSDSDIDFGRNPVIVLGGGDDQLKLGSYNRDAVDSLVVCAGDGNDDVELREGVGGRAEITLDGGRGDDFVGNQGSSKRGSDIPSMALIGGAGDDMMRGANSDDQLIGGQGDDTEYGVGGRDVMSGGSGDDQLNGERGSDRLKGGSGSDVLYGDIRHFRDGDDFANGGGGRDTCKAEKRRNCER